jgi:hypothetical protein
MFRGGVVVGGEEFALIAETFDQLCAAEFLLDHD